MKILHQTLVKRIKSDLLFFSNSSILFIITLLFLAIPLTGQTVDEDYQVSLYKQGKIDDIVYQQGGLYIEGDFIRINDSSFPIGFTRLAMDGKVDNAYVFNYTGLINDFAVDSSGRTYMVGELVDENGMKREGVLRILENGQIDENFHFQNDQSFMSIKININANNEIFVMAAKGDYNTRTLFYLDENGNIDDSKNSIDFFGSPIGALETDSHYYIWGGGLGFENSQQGNSILKFNKDGTEDFNFSNNNLIFHELFGQYLYVTQLYVLEENKIFISGGNSEGLYLLNQDGTTDDIIFVNEDIFYPVSITKQVSNSLVAGYSGNGQFYIYNSANTTNENFQWRSKLNHDQALPFTPISESEIILVDQRGRVLQYDITADNIDTLQNSAIYDAGVVSSVINHKEGGLIVVGDIIQYGDDQALNNITSLDDNGKIKEAFNHNNTFGVGPIYDIEQYSNGDLFLASEDLLLFTDPSGNLIDTYIVNDPYWPESSKRMAVSKVGEDRFIAFSKTGSFGYSLENTREGAPILYWSGDVIDLIDQKGIRCFALADIITDANNDIYIFGDKTSYESTGINNILKLDSELNRYYDFNSDYELESNDGIRAGITIGEKLYVLHTNLSGTYLSCLDNFGNDCSDFTPFFLTDSYLHYFSGMLPISSDKILLYGIVDSIAGESVNNHVVIDTLGNYLGTLFDYPSSVITYGLMNENKTSVYLFGEFKQPDGTFQSSIKVDLDIMSATEDIEKNHPLRQFPTLVRNGVTYIENNSSENYNSIITILDASGKVLSKENQWIHTGIQPIALPSMDSGIYFLNIAANEITFTSRFVVVE